MVTLQTKIHWKTFCLEQWMEHHGHVVTAIEAILGVNGLDFFKNIDEVKKICIIESLSILANFSDDPELILCLIWAECPDAIPFEIDKTYIAVLKQYQQLEKALKIIKVSNDHMKENIRKMLMVLVDDPRLVVLMLCQVLCYLRHRQYFDTGEIHNLARASLEIFAPIAHRLGIGQVKWEMEDLAFRVLHLSDYKYLSEELAQSRVQREHYIEQVKEFVGEILNIQGIQASITGRPKHFYSIWRKMLKKNKSLAQIYDLHAIRILVDTHAECYRALGAIHTQWHYLPEEFDDYIANAKINGYQSIHTAVIGPNQRVIEVQIRTHEMDTKAELGIAAHWVYKDNKKHALSYRQKLETLRGLLSRSETASADIFENVKEEIFGDRKYVFTPKGDVFDLPTGATGLDLAYLIHTDLGHRCSGVKINGKIQALSTSLKNGDVVEVLCANKNGPSRDWLNPSYGYIVTSRARQKITHWFRSLDRDKLIQDGKIYLEKEFKKLGMVFKDYQEKIVHNLKLQEKDDLFFLVAIGDLKLSRILDKIESSPVGLRSAKIVKTPAHRQRELSKAVSFYQMSSQDVKYDFANCCQPQPGDPIVGVINRGTGINIHKSECPNLGGIPHIQDRLLGAYWKDMEESYRERTVTLIIVAVDREGLVNEITSILLRYSVTIDSLQTATHKESHTATITVEFGHLPFSQLHHLIDKIAQITSVIDINSTLVP